MNLFNDSHDDQHRHARPQRAGERRPEEDRGDAKPSPVSMMPEGLLDTLERDEILDLIAYLLSRGDRDHEMFR